ncbi:MAG: CBS domain-containing protein, partial [Magnetococcales bacterium]|nr:CBS domain-containing protein [Magnetococcales bacterium]
FFPIVFVFSRFARFFTKLVSGKSTKKSPYITREEIRALLDLPDTITSDDDEDRRFDKERVRSIIRYAETSVGSAMLPLADVVGLNETKSMSDAIEIVTKNDYHRLPIYRGNITNVVGILDLKTWDLLDPDLPKRKIEELMLPPLFITPKQTIHEILPLLISRQERMAVVVDEYGSAIGILLLEDVFEDVIGEPHEHTATQLSGTKGKQVEKPVPHIEHIGEDEYLIPGRTSIIELNEELHLNLPVNESYTIAGLMVNRLRMIPKIGVSLVIDKYLFTVQESDGRIVTKISMQPV